MPSWVMKVMMAMISYVTSHTKSMEASITIIHNVPSLSGIYQVYAFCWRNIHFQYHLVDSVEFLCDISHRSMCS